MLKQLYCKAVDGGVRVRYMVDQQVQIDQVITDETHPQFIQDVVLGLENGDDIMIYHSPLPHIFLKTMASNARVLGAKLAYQCI